MFIKKKRELLFFLEIGVFIKGVGGNLSDE